MDFVKTKKTQLKAKDVLPNINHMQANKRAKKCHFCPWWPWPLTFKLVRARDQTHLHTMWIWRKFVHQFSRYLICKQKKPQTDSTKNRNFRSSLPFTACDKKVTDSVKNRTLCSYCVR